MSNTITLYTYNILESGTVTVTGTPDAAYPEARLYDRAISLFWLDTVTEAKVFHVDQGASGNKAVDTLIIEKHNFSGEDMEWNYSTDDFSGDNNDAVTDWTQGDHAQVVKEMVAEQTKRYWRVQLTSMDNPKCSELWMTKGYDFDVMVNPLPVLHELANVRWNRTFGGPERCTKFGEERRVRSYGLMLDATDRTTFRARMDDLDGYSKPFYIKDHEDDVWLCRLNDIPREEPNARDDRTRVVLDVVEVL